MLGDVGWLLWGVKMFGHLFRNEADLTIAIQQHTAWMFFITSFHSVHSIS